jgi:hypothetical protein
VFLLQITLECTWELPHKMPCYGTLVSLRRSPTPSLLPESVKRISPQRDRPAGLGSSSPCICMPASADWMPGLTHSVVCQSELTLGPPLSSPVQLGLLNVADEDLSLPKRDLMKVRYLFPSFFLQLSSNAVQKLHLT